MSTIRWTEDRTVRTVAWHSENGGPPPARVTTAGDRMRADRAYRLASEGTALLWRGDYHNARLLLEAMGRRLDRIPLPAGATPAESFHLYRRARAHRARVLGRLLVILEAGHVLNLRRAPDVRRACDEAYGASSEAKAVSLRELLGVLGAARWRAEGVAVPALGARVHPHYGVFSSVRGEYVDLVAEAPLPSSRRAFDLGTGTGVLSAVLARRGFGRVVATDISPRALACTRDNVGRLGLSDVVEVAGPGLYPDGRADLVVCNPPWIPARPPGGFERGVYDAGGAMLKDFLAGLPSGLEPGGEGWLVMSDLAELLGLRGRGELAGLIESAGLRVVDRLQVRPRHRRALDRADPLHAARVAEVTSLWRLRVA